MKKNIYSLQDYSRKTVPSKDKKNIINFHIVLICLLIIVQSGFVFKQSYADINPSISFLRYINNWFQFPALNLLLPNADIDSVSPGQNKLNILLTSDMKTYFHQSMNGSTMDSNTITFFGSMTGRKQGTISYNSGNNSMQVVPTSPFKYGELISTTLDTGIKTGSGVPIEPFVWSFMTKAKPSNLVFNQTGTIGVGASPREITTGDFDGDGDLDLAFNNTSYSTILKNNGNGTFSVSSSVGVNSSYGITTGDLDGDGDLDLAITNYNHYTISILKNNGTGTFTLSSTVEVSSNPTLITTGDFDGDGYLDLAVANRNSDNVSILKNNGTGTFTVSSSVGVETLPYGITKGDFNSDGDLDLVVANAGSNTVSILNNNGTGTFTVSSSVVVGTTPFGVTTGDFDGDGDLDLTVANISSNTVSILKNNGTGTFILSSTVEEVSSPYFSTTGDLDGDGDLDIAVNNYNSNTISLLKNNGTGTYTVSSSVGAGTNPCGITTGDFNSDGVLDIATANYGSNNVNILMNLTPPVSLNPANNSVGNLNALNFSWNKSKGAGNYRLQISTDSTFGSFVVNDSTLLGTDSVKSVSGLNPLTWYYWRMNSKSDNGLSLWGDTWKFKTQGEPVQVTLYSPSNNAVNQPINITFQWYKTIDQTLAISNEQLVMSNGKARAGKNEKKSPDAISKYWFEYSTDSNFVSGVVRDSLLTDTTKTVSELNNALKYYWRVKAKNETGWSEFSAIWNFSTVAKIDSVSPAQNKLNVPLTSDMKAYFQQSMNGSTMDSNSVTFFGSMTGRKQGTITYNSGNNSMQIVPISPF